MQDAGRHSVPDDVATCCGSNFCRDRGGGRRKERRGKGEEKRSLDSFSYEVYQNCKAPVGQNHRPFAVFDYIKLKLVQQEGLTWRKGKSW